MSGQSLDSMGPWIRSFGNVLLPGLNQPLGLKIVGEQIYVAGRDQITRLVDLNADGETDFYENFNNDAYNSEHFHEQVMDLQTDAVWVTSTT